MAKVDNFAITKEVGSDHGLLLSWKWDKKTYTESFTVDYEYWTGSYKKKVTEQEEVWVSAGTSDVSVADSLISGKNFRISWTAPDVAIKARARVKPNCKKKIDKKNKFTGAYCSKKTIDFRNDPLPVPSLSVEFDENTSKVRVTVSSSDADARSGKIVAHRGSTVVKNTKNVTLKNGGYTTNWTVPAGETWSIHAKVMTNENKKASPWTTDQYVTAKPGAPSLVSGSAKAYGEDGITFKWKAVTGATSYVVEYVADSSSYFKTQPSAVESETITSGTTFVKQGLEAGHTWYMRVKAVNSTGDGSWSSVTPGVKLALVPDAPTTYDTSPSYMVSDSVRLRWTHNCEDESDQTAAQVRMKLSDDDEATSYTVSPGTNSYYVKSLSSYSDGDVVMWSVRTKGAHSDWSPWSVWRQFSVYSMPTVSCSISQTSGAVDDDDDKLASLPMTVSLGASGGGSSVVGYHVMITASDSVERTEKDGSVTRLAPGSVIFQKDYTTTSNPFTATLGIEAGIPNDSNLSLTASATMASGLRATSSPISFAVDFSSSVPEPECAVFFDDDELTAEIWASCYNYNDNGVGTLASGVVLSVYRIDSDGTLVLIEEGLPNTGNVSVVDPHASFGTCAYRTVAMSTSTGEINFVDGSDESPHSTCAVQWEEEWTGYAESEDDEAGAAMMYTGNRIDGLYNLNFDESNDVQSEDVEYIGRKHPVSYFGTQLGHKASYQIDFPKGDIETLSKCRRLMSYPGVVYVREPSGSGFYARISNQRITRNFTSHQISFSFEAVHVDNQEYSVSGETGE